MEYQVKFCHHSGPRLWRTRMLFSTKSKGHKSNVRISWMYRYRFYNLKLHFWWPNKRLKCHISSWHTLYTERWTSLIVLTFFQAIIYEYTDWLQPTDPLKNRDALDRMVGDYAFTCPVVNFAHRYAETGNNVYFYYFNERASNNPWPTWTGVLHGDEIAFIFGDPLNKSRNYDAAEIGLAKRMMSYWANFAKTG